MSPDHHFPTTRLRRLRYNPAVRRLVQETALDPGKLILPLFVRAGEGVRQEIASMPGNFQLSPDQLGEEVREAAGLGLGGIILFGIPAKKDATGSDSTNDEGIIQQAIRAAKEAAPDMLVTSDVCFCEYTDHGHCGVLNDKTGHLDVDNDATLELLGLQALSHARAGADLVAPSGMMDGMVGEVRDSLDGEGHENVAIMAYAIKQASAFYGPFREAVQSAPEFGDRKGYQMDVRNWREAMREAALDQAQGADILMVKPGMPCLDLLARLREETSLPLAAYQVSGEYAMIKAAAANGWLDGDACMREAMQAFKRAGANMVITYAALELAESF